MTKAEIKTLLNYAGLFLLIVGMVTMIVLSFQYPYPGSFNALMATPDQPLMGFWIAMGMVGFTALGMILYLFSFTLEE